MKVSPSTRYVMLVSLGGALIYGVIGAVTLRWYWGVFLALWALILGQPSLCSKHSAERSIPDVSESETGNVIVLI
jgi:hypothetical protein